MKCKKCGNDAPERAVICPECGEILPRQKEGAVIEKESGQTMPDRFSMPFLNSVPEKLEQAEDETIEDPVELQRQKREERTKLRRRITGVSIIAVLLLAIILYTIFLGGYKLAVFRYVKGIDYNSGSMYASLVPDAYLDYLENTYNVTRREVKEMVGDYFISWNKKSDDSGGTSYKINSTEKIDDTLELEEELASLYGISVEIKKAVTVDLTIDEGGKKMTESLVFVKIGQRWCSIEAMNDIEYVCQYDGYGQW